MQIEIDTGSRLHFGLLCPKPDQRWYYGGIGLMVNEPGCRLSVSTMEDQDTDRYDLEDCLVSRTRKIVNDFRAASNVSFPPASLPSVCIRSHRPIPLHSGLGTGTQLTLGIAAACRILSGEGLSRDVSEMARQFGRSRRSAIGTMGFVGGGFLVDYGRLEDRVERMEFPEEWRFVLVRPLQSAGMSGDTEEAFFGDRPPLDPNNLQRLERRILNQIVPAIESKNFEQFASGLQEYGDLAGADFADAQGGLFSSAVVRDALKQLSKSTTFTAVQSSWGPTVCLPTSSEQEALQRVLQLKTILDDSLADITVTSARNHGATIRTDGNMVQRTLG